jgi:iron complex outermembrane receptor protein
MTLSRRALAAAISRIVAQFACANDNQLLEEIAVTGARMDEPLTVVTDPKAPRQPLPAHDGAGYLTTIPGFSVIRKDGTDGDPVFRKG